MAWQQIHLTVSANDFDVVNDFFESVDALSITVLDAGDEPIFEPDPEQVIIWQQNKFIILFPLEADLPALMQLLEQRLNKSLSYEISYVADIAWEKVCQQDFPPLHCGKNLWICPSWSTVDEPNAVVVHLDPGLAFGTGTHPTTRLCLEWLATHDLKNKTVIDYGCGSGILAVSASKLGAQQLYAVDNDPQALTATNDNAQKNNVALWTGLPHQLPDVQADVLVANILANPLISLASIFTRLVKPNGELILSGILADQIPLIINAYSSQFYFNEPIQMGDWVCLTARKGLL